MAYRPGMSNAAFLPGAARAVGTTGAAETTIADAAPIVLHQIRDLAAELRREADTLRAAVTRLNGFAVTVEWQSSSSRACLDELGEFSRRLIAYAEGYDVAALMVVAHADQAEAAAAQLLLYAAIPAI